MKKEQAIESNFRQPNQEEKEIVTRLLEPEFPGKEALVQQLAHYRVRRLDSEGSLEFETRFDQSAAPVTKRVPVEAEASDDDGVPIHILLHIVDGRVKELEIFKNDGSPIQRMPSAAELRLVVLGWDRPIVPHR